MIEQKTMPEVWKEIEQALSSNSEPYSDLTVAYSIELTGDEGGLYGLRFADGTFEITKDEVKAADCMLKMSVGNFKKLLTGNLNTTASFMMGKLKVKGNVGFALKLESLLKQYNFA